MQPRKRLRVSLYAQTVFFTTTPNPLLPMVSLLTGKNGAKPREPLQQTAIGYIPPHYVEKSQSVHSNFCRFISSLLDSLLHGQRAKGSVEKVNGRLPSGSNPWRCGHLLADWPGRTRCTLGKVMQYNPNDGHRVKDGQASAVNWIHSILKRQRYGWRK